MDAFFQKLLSIVGTIEGQVAVIALIVEFLLRAVKTQKPVSLLFVAAAFCHKVAGVFAAVGSLLDKLFQRLAPPAA